MVWLPTASIGGGFALFGCQPLQVYVDEVGRHPVWRQETVVDALQKRIGVGRLAEYPSTCFNATHVIKKMYDIVQYASRCFSLCREWRTPVYPVLALRNRIVYGADNQSAHKRQKRCTSFPGKMYIF